ncbi:hypothetical protein KIW84_063187 [Lathyrus oleraceus]|uniref:Uncharacterized protein n=1 Tax=Pisum sativum TaxID=3888 RepID=A0A9D5A7F2_PEA|nr:hypothetical protein KIW84_063187 [Pisum sativum]
MVNTTNQGEQFPPQGTGTIRANSIDVSTEIPNAQAIPTSGSMALHNSTAMPIMSGAADTPAVSTPRPPGFENFRHNAIRDGRLKFADKGKNQMKVDTDPLNIADTNYVEPVEINMFDLGEVEAVKATRTGGYTLDGKQATDGLSNDVSF